MRVVQKWFYSATRKRAKLGINDIRYPYIVYSLESKGIYEPFRFYEENGWKMRGYSKENKKFYFNDVEEKDKLSAMGKMTSFMYGRRRK